MIISTRDTLDEAVRAGAAVLRDHEYRVDVPSWVPYCTCGWRGSKDFATEEFDEHVFTLALKEAWPILAELGSGTHGWLHAATIGKRLAQKEMAQ